MYVGKTNDVERRFKEHQYRATINYMTPLHCAIRKYGIAHFDILIIDSFSTDSDAFNAERFWIDSLGTRFHGYNLTDGGEGTSGHVWSSESRTKLSSNKKQFYSIMTGADRKQSTEPARSSTTPDVKSKWMKDWHSSLTNEQKIERAERSRKTMMARTPEERSKLAKKAVMTGTTEERSKRARKASLSRPAEERSRTATAIECGRRKSQLSDDDVRAIREDTRVQRVIAMEYHTSRSTVSAIKTGTRFNYIQ